jgi:outer membrane lipoprotein-sorting protein
MRDLFIIIAMLTLLLLGCKLPSSLTRSDSNAAPASEDMPVSSDKGTQINAGDDPREEVIAASKKFLDQTSFIARMDTVGTPNQAMEVSFLAPDRFWIVADDPAGKMSAESVIIGEDVYVKIGSKWQKFPMGFGMNTPNIRELFNEAGLESLKDVRYEGEGSVDDRPALVYTYRNERSDGADTYPFTSRIWIVRADGLPHKIEVDYSSGPIRKLTIRYDFEAKVNIDPPM